MPLDISTDRPADLGWWRPRSETEVIRDQVAGIDAWNLARRAVEMAEDAGQVGECSREMRLDLARRRDVIRRQQQAIVDHTEQQLRHSARMLRSASPTRAVIAHRNEWFTGKVVDGLLRDGIEVVAQLDNGADAVGVAVAEQPDLLLVEDKLAMINGEEVIRQVREFCACTVTAAQVSSDIGFSALLEAGAHAAFLRRVPPAEVARDLAELVRV